MKISKKHLQNIIQEEIVNLLTEEGKFVDPKDVGNVLIGLIKKYGTGKINSEQAMKIYEDIMNILTLGGTVSVGGIDRDELDRAARAGIAKVTKPVAKSPTSR